MNIKTYYNLQSTQAIFFIKHTSSLGREEASSSFNNLPLFDGDKFPLLCTTLKKDHDQPCTELYTKKKHRCQGRTNRFRIDVPADLASESYQQPL